MAEFRCGLKNPPENATVLTVLAEPVMAPNVMFWVAL